MMQALLLAACVVAVGCAPANRSGLGSGSGSGEAVSALGAGTASKLLDTNFNRAPATSALEPAVPFRGAIFHVAEGRTVGRELWRTDADGGTTLVIDLHPGRGSSLPTSFFVASDHLYSSAIEPGVGRELWRTDGTKAGTTLVLDAYPGPRGSDFQQPARLGNRLLFTAATPDNPSRLFVLDLTTGAFEPILPSAGDGALDVVSRLTVVGGRAYFAVAFPSGGFGNTHHRLWTTDGTAAGTHALPATVVGPGNAPYFVPCGADVCFGARPFPPELPLVTPQLWKTDGTEAGTMPAADLSGSAEGGTPLSLHGFGEDVLFVAQDPADNVIKLVRYVASTGSLVRIKTQPSHGPGDSGVTIGSLFFFSRHDAALGQHLEVTDGTAAGTRTLVPVGLPFDAQRGPLVAAGDRLVFCNTSAAGTELWTSDGTLEGTRMVVDLVPGSTGLRDCAGLASVGDAAWFPVDWTRGTYAGIYRTDGTATGTVRIVVAPADGAPAWSWLAFSQARGHLLWRERILASPDTAGHLVQHATVQRWTTDLGTPNTPRNWETPSQVLEAGNTTFFAASSSVSSTSSNVLLAWNGPPTSARALFSTNTTTPATHYSLEPLGDRVVVGHSRLGLFSTDGTGPGTATLLATSTAFLCPRTGATDWMGRLGQQVFFPGGTSATGCEPWVTDGTAAGTRLAFQLAAGSAGSNPQSFRTAGGRLFFLVETGSLQLRLLASDGSLAGTTTLHDARGSPTTDGIDGLVALGDRLLFFAADDAGNRFLWSSDGTVAGTQRLSDAWLGDATSLPRPPVVAGGFAYFAAADRTRGFELHRTDGTVAGTALVADLQPGIRSSLPSSLTAVGEALLFTACDDTSGCEPRVVRPGASEPLLVEDLAPNGNANPFDYAPLAGGNDVAFSAETDTDASVDGFRLDARLLDAAPTITCPADLRVVVHLPSDLAITFPSATATDDGTVAPVISSRPASGATLALGTNVITASATDSRGGRGTCTFEVEVIDPDPPEVTCPAAQVREASEPRGAWVTYSATAVDVLDDTTLEYEPPSGEWFTRGDHLVSVTARDGAGNTSACTFPVRVQDTTPPVVTCPPTFVVEATGPDGALVTLPSPAANDLAGPVSIRFEPPDGGRFPLGTTGVRAVATDVAGLTATCTFDVDVRDRTAPVVSCPADVFALSGTTHATVTYPPATATDLAGATTLTYSHPSGGLFARGATSVTATARDVAGNTSSCAFTVTVNDQPPYDVTCPASLPVEATSLGPQRVEWTPGLVTGARPPATLSFDPPPGSLFPHGRTPVVVRASHPLGYASECRFDVHLRDSIAPRVRCPPGVGAEATGPDGARVSFGAATATDELSDPVLATSHASGDVFPVGSTTVTVTATDPAGNAGHCTFTVFVLDTTPPTLACPADVETNAGLTLLTPVEWPAPVATDLAGDVEVRAEPPSGAGLPVGRTRVEVSATDAAGLVATCHFHVDVRDRTAPTLDCPVTVGAEATGPGGAEVAWTPPVARDVHSDVSVVTTPPSGSSFALGRHAVAVVATDVPGNAVSCTFDVHVVDTTPPTLRCPVVAAVEAAGADGAFVGFDVEAEDVVSAVQLQLTHAAGSLFSLGSTEVEARASDDAGNEASCRFTVHVVDTTAPVLDCPTLAIDLEATDAAGAALVLATPGAVDAVSTAVVTVEPAAGTVLALGTHAVDVVAHDDAGNVSRCEVTVHVVDTRAPSLECPTDARRLEARDATGAPLELELPTARDAVSEPQLSIEPPLGTTLPLGSHAVSLEATDAAGNVAPCTVTVEVVDSVAPFLACPPEVRVVAEASGDVGVSLDPAEVSDAVSPVTVTSNPPSGARFPTGVTVVEFVAEDAAGNTSRCTMRVVVEPPVDAPASPCGCGGGSSSLAGLLGLAGLVRRRRGVPANGAAGRAIPPQVST